MTEMLDHVLPFVTEQADTFQKSSSSKPLFVALNGVQGAGKTTLVTAIAEKLRSPPLSLRIAVVSIDDFYLPHQQQKQLALSHAENPLVQHRGQPSTHDVPLMKQVFESLSQLKATKIPQYDKSCFNGQGDRVDPGTWETVNQSIENEVKVVIFEGWCVGFRALPEQDVKGLWARACTQKQERPSEYSGRLGWNRLEDVVFINEALREYEKLNKYFDIMVHIDAEDTNYVYNWRLEQESALRKAKGVGMTDEEVRHFVDGYYPSYELYTDTLREGVFAHDASRASNIEGRQLRIIINKDRKAIQAIKI